jgi:predicted SAM-dependent methyltransferase|tara:strand:+ start:48 stop:593 length:546 start_codon:yes stop_codon:yes gene_type:complete
VKLHLGCGKRYLEGYIHVDIAEFEHIDYQLPIDDLSTFKDNTIEEIYASHVLEYFDRNDVINVLTEWKRVLKPSGILRLAVPNFPKLVEVYQSSKDLSSILGPLYGKWDIGNQEFIYHKTVYDENSLKNVLEEVGFKNIKIWDWKEFFKEQKDFDDHSQAYYPHMQKDSGIHVSLNLQCEK